MRNWQISVIAMLTVLMWNATSMAAVVAYDDAADPAYNSLGNYHAQNGGFGFNAFTTNAFPIGGNPALQAYVNSSTINDGGNIGPDIDTAGRAWGNNAQPSGNTLTIRRNASVAVGVGGTLSLNYDSGDVDGRETITFGDGNNVLCQFYFDGSQANYQFVDGTNAPVDTGILQTFTGLSLTVTRTAAANYSFQALRLVDSFAYSFAGAYSTVTIPNLRTITVTNTDGGNGPGHAMYINAMQETAVPEPAGVISLFAMGAAVMARRRSRLIAGA